MEYRQFVATKTFMISIIMMPLLMGSMVVVQIWGGMSKDLSDKRFAVYDRSGVLYEKILAAANRHNQYDLFLKEGGLPTKQVNARYLPENYSDDPTLSIEAVEHLLSEQVRKDAIFAFVVIDEHVLDTDLATDGGGPVPTVRYYSNRPAHQQLPQWLAKTLDQAVQRVRFEQAGIDLEQVERLSERVQLERLGLAGVDEDGSAQRPQGDNELLVYSLPIAVVMLLFICANMSTPLMLNSVIEEKMNKIAEVLMASVSPFQLILGKLIGTVAVGLTLSGIYLSGTLVLLIFSGFVHEIPVAVFFWFFVFLTLTLLCFGSLWAGIGAVCSQVKDTQNFTGVAALFVILPMVLAPVVLLAPEGGFARVLSLIPPFTPFLMMMRIAIPPGVPLGEILLGVGLTLLFTLAVVWAGAKLFRLGLLWQGQTPSLTQIGHWLVGRRD